jgi:hypothetical protein
VTSRAVKKSAKKAAKTSALKRRHQKEEEERQAGNQEPVIDFDPIGDVVRRLKNQKQFFFYFPSPKEILTQKTCW